jgi:acyl carrier protein
MASNGNQSEVRDAVVEVAASVFEVPAAELPLDASPETIDTWDSLNHLKLITAVETRFDIRLPMKVVLGIDSVAALVQAVEDCDR